MKQSSISMGVVLALATMSAAHAATTDDLLLNAKAGVVPAQREIGQAYLVGDGVPQDIGTGVAWLEKAATANDPYAAYLLAEHFATLPNTPANHNTMVRYLQTAAKLGHTTAQAKLGKMLLIRAQAQTLSAEDKQHARQQGMDLLEFAATAHNALANLELAKLYNVGTYGIAKNIPKAVTYYEAASAAHDASASQWLAEYYLADPRSTNYDLNRGITYLQAAANGRMPSSALALAERYETGAGVPKDLDRAIAQAHLAQSFGAKGAAALIVRLNGEVAQAKLLSTPAASVASAPTPAPKTRLQVAPVAQPVSAPVKLITARGEAPTKAEPISVAPLTQGISRRMDAMEVRMRALEHDNTVLTHKVDVTTQELASLRDMKEQVMGSGANQVATNAAIHDANVRVTKTPKPNQPEPIKDNRDAGAAIDHTTRAMYARTARQPTPATLIVGNAKKPVSVRNVIADQSRNLAPGSNPAGYRAGQVHFASNMIMPETVEPVVAIHVKVDRIVPTQSLVVSTPALKQIIFDAAPLASTSAPNVQAKPPAVAEIDADFANEHGVQALQDGDYNKALTLFKHAAMAGNHRGMNNLGMLYFRGFGVDRNVLTAIGYFERAASGGDAGAANNLGYIFEYGVGVAPSRSKAITWYRRAIELGNSTSRKALQELTRIRDSEDTETIAAR